jgi:addiction module RelE/StbE family toxin
MAKKIIWTQTAIEDRFRIYRFWLYKTKSKTYSEKLEKLFKDSANLISKFPDLGPLTDFNGIRSKSVKHYQLFYQITSDTIHIIRVWDTWQNPEKLELE